MGRGTARASAGGGGVLAAARVGGHSPQLQLTADASDQMTISVTSPKWSLLRYTQQMKPLNSRTTYAMSKVRQARTAPEERVALALRQLGIRYRRNVRTLPGTPDFVNQSRGWAIQVHGCFWHNHDCKRGALPVHNRDAWSAKLDRNKARDSEVDKQLKARGLNVVTLWECELKDEAALKNRLSSYLR